MLEIQITGREFYNDETGEFATVEPQTLRLEHSLYAIAKWEAKWKKPFLADEKIHKKTYEELLDYIRCMSLDEDVDPLVFLCLTQDDFMKITKYMNDPMTATWFRKEQTKGQQSNETVTSELVYYWLSAAQIPFETQYWHFNRLMTLIRVASIKSQPPKKMSKRDVLRQNHSINQARRNALAKKKPT